MTSEIEAAPETRSWLYHPTFPAGWTPAPLYSLATWVNGLAFRDIQFTKVGKPVIKIAEIKGGITGQTKFTTQTFDEKVRVRPGDMLFSWSGQPETSIDVFRWDGPEGWLNQHVFKLTAGEKLLPDFLFYLLRYLKPNFVAIAKNKQTTGLGHVTKRDLERMGVAYPPKDEQREIVAILGAIDGRIDALRRINATLEEMARALYQSWFVDFDPVRAKAKGLIPTGVSAEIAALLPNTLQQTDIGDLPEGWGYQPFSNLTKLITKGTTPRQSDITTAPDSGSHINYIRVNAIEDDGTISPERITSIPQSVHLGVLKRSILMHGDLLYTIAGTIGRSSLVEDWILPANTNQAVAIIRPAEDVPTGFLLLALQEDTFRTRLHSKVVHAVQANLSLGTISAAEVIVPPRAQLRSLFEPINELLGKISTNKAQIRTLDSLRETLLPKLMSGELSPIQSAKEVEFA